MVFAYEVQGNHCIMLTSYYFSWKLTRGQKQQIYEVSLSCWNSLYCNACSCPTPSPPRRQWSSKLSVFRFLNSWLLFLFPSSSTADIRLSLRCCISLPSVRDSVGGFLWGRVCLAALRSSSVGAPVLPYSLHRKHFLILPPACLLNFPPSPSQILSFF